MIQVYERINPASSPLLPTTIHHAAHRSDNSGTNAAWEKASVPKSSSSGNKLVPVPPPEALVDGIYVGEGHVIHLTRTGVDKTSLDRFQQEGKNLYSLRLYAYGRPQLGYWLTRWGTCTTLPVTKSSQEVVNKARELHEHDSFGVYDLINNNCEHFASFCRTDIRASAQTALVSACGQKISEVKEWFMKFLQTNKRNETLVLSIQFWTGMGSERHAHVHGGRTEIRKCM
ncbi:protein LEAD-SENSITIVE 1-like [Syzygium oleosum]|uniref:protein LEAD-SENSITIVE 1-like n=1 Tax=Syzygium oleosum TaxID=219896 RepID=UPI0011D25CEC|nr:protein LEAD-SENSITIVE 1-like [Syzygium oleosum]